MTNSICSFPDCGRKFKARNLCTGHLSQRDKGWELRPIGVSNRGRPPRLSAGSPRSIEDFWSAVDKSKPCWEWLGPVAHGYGQINLPGLHVGAHRLSWQIANGAVPPGMVIDHMCHNSLCVNPDHLRAVTPKQNSENRRGAASHSKSGVRNVYRDRGSWRVEICHGGKKIYVGSYAALVDAEAAAISARARYFSHATR